MNREKGDSMMKLLILCVALSLPAAPAAADFGLWCEGGDVVRVEIDGSDATIVHEAALYNCCPDPFQYDVSWDGDVLLVTETEILTYPCYCVCCFDLYTTVENVPPGDWTVRFAWYDYETDAWLQMDVPFTVGNVGQEGPVLVGLSDSSGCLSSSDVDVPPGPATSWSSVKALYR